MLLLVSLPQTGVAGAHDDGAAHAPEFNKWLLDAFTDCIAELGSPTCITVCGETMMLV
jgi:hypothetical protein